jgi:hypothetical protein
VTRAVTRAATGAALALLTLLGLVACTGTFTPPVPTLYLVVTDAVAGNPARVALLAFAGEPGAQRIDLLEGSAFTFAPDERPIALGIRDRQNRSEAWVLLADVNAPRAVRLERLALNGLVAAPGTTLTRAAAPLALTDAEGAWIGFTQASGLASGCITNLVVADDGASLALFDPGSGARCGAVTASAGARVHVLDLVARTVRDTIDDAIAPGVRAGDAAALLLIRRPLVGDAGEGEVFAVTFAEPRPDFGAASTRIAGLLDVAATRGGFAALQTREGQRQIAVHDDGGVRERIAPPNASTLIADDVGALDALLTLGGGRVGVIYPSGDEPRSLFFDATAATIEPLNAYALAVRANGSLCLIDMYVPTTSSRCDADARSDVAAALVGARWVTWSYALPNAP